MFFKIYSHKYVTYYATMMYQKPI